MIDLDSTTRNILSRHWTLHLPRGKLFSDARKAGIFVKCFTARLERERESLGLQARGRALLAEHLFVKTQASASEDGGKALHRLGSVSCDAIGSLLCHAL